MRVLVVEDEVRLAENVARAMREGPGYAVDVARDGEEAELFCRAGHHYDLILLDLMLPKVSGSEVLARLRSWDDSTPVMVLTAVVDTSSKIKLLDLGADDYLTKPFDLGELIARSRALVRRGKGRRQTVLELGSLCLHLAEQRVTVAGKEVPLSPTEYRILEYLMHRQKTVVSKRELLEHLYDFTWEHHSNVVEAHVSNLRRKLRAETEAMVLETMRGRGYRIAAWGGEEG